MRTVRLLVIGWALNLKMLSKSAFDGVLGVLWPLVFATIAFFMYRAGGNDASLLYASLGASVMGVWSSTSVAATPSTRCSSASRPPPRSSRSGCSASYSR